MNKLIGLATGWQGMLAALALTATSSFGAGWTVRGWQADSASLADEEANNTALVARIDELQRKADIATQRAIEASVRVDELSMENTALRTNLEAMTANVQISDPCAQCRLGSDAVRVLQSAATGSVEDIPE